MTDEFGNQKQKIAEKVKIAGISGVKMVIDHGKNKNRYQSTNAEQCLPEKKICITSILNLGIISTCTVKHDKPKTGEKDYTGQKIVIIILTVSCQKSYLTFPPDGFCVCLCHIKSCLSIRITMYHNIF